MPKIALLIWVSFVTFVARRWTVGAVGVTLTAAGAGWLAAPASASHSQIAIIQDGGDLANPAGTLAQFRELGANTVRVIVPWATIAPDPRSKHKPSFEATDPNAYAASAWQPYDQIVQQAQVLGLTVDLTVTGGAPRWAERSGVPPQSTLYYAWKPSAADYGQFVRAVGERYDGHFEPAGASSPLPAVHFWTIFNEPNFGEDLGPQASARASVAPMRYRRLVDAGWSALQATGHGYETILIGEFAARGIRHPGNYGQTPPLTFIRTLYCVDSHYRELRGSAAKRVGCPTNAAGSRRFRRQNPGLFLASGVGDHPYPGNQSPVDDGRSDPNFAAFPDLGRLETALDKVNRVYGSGKRYSIYNDEYGYITSPPARKPYVSPTTAAYYLNWAEYLSWRQPRVASYMQYLLEDPPPTARHHGGFSSGLEDYTGRPKPTYAAYRLPLYLPTTSFSPSASVEVWGDARPAPFMARDGDGTQTIAIQLNGKTIHTVTVTQPGGYFELHMKFPRSGTVRLAYTYPRPTASWRSASSVRPSTAEPS